MKNKKQINQIKEDLVWEKYFFRTAFGTSLLFLLPLVLEGFFGAMFMLLIGLLTIKSTLNMVGLFRIENRILKEKKMKTKKQQKRKKEKTYYLFWSIIIFLLLLFIIQIILPNIK